MNVRQLEAAVRRGVPELERRMKGELAGDPSSFKRVECTGWQKGAASYDELFGTVTRHAIEPLLDATSVRAETDIRGRIGLSAWSATTGTRFNIQRGPA